MPSANHRHLAWIVCFFTRLLADCSTRSFNIEVVWGDPGPILLYFWHPGDPLGSLWAPRRPLWAPRPEKVRKSEFLPPAPGHLRGPIFNQNRYFSEKVSVCVECVF